MPTAVAEEQDYAQPAEKQIGEGHGVEGAQADRGLEHRQQQVQRREHERLRIGNLRPAGEDIGRPPWPFAARNRRRQELHLRIELRFRVPRDGDRAGQPRPGRCQKCEREDRDDEEKRDARRCAGGGRWPAAGEPRRQRILKRRRCRRLVPQVHSLSGLMPALPGVGAEPNRTPNGRPKENRRIAATATGGSAAIRPLQVRSHPVQVPGLWRSRAIIRPKAARKVAFLRYPEAVLPGAWIPSLHEMDVAWPGRDR
jgi:hypothetical protein